MAQHHRDYDSLRRSTSRTSQRSQLVSVRSRCFSNEIKVDNNQDAVADITFQFRFQPNSERRILFQAFAGAGRCITAPANSPSPVPPGSTIVHHESIHSRRKGSAPKALRGFHAKKWGRYSLSKGITRSMLSRQMSGPRTMDYAALFTAGNILYTNTIREGVCGYRPTMLFGSDLGGAFDTLNTHISTVLNHQKCGFVKNFAAIPSPVSPSIPLLH